MRDMHEIPQAELEAWRAQFGKHPAEMGAAEFTEFFAKVHRGQITIPERLLLPAQHPSGAADLVAGQAVVFFSPTFPATNGGH